MSRIEFAFARHSGPQPTGADLRARLEAEGLTAQTWSNGPHVSYDWHTHTRAQVLVCVSGSIKMTVADAAGDLDCLMESGDRLDLPANTRHRAQVGAAGVTMLEADAESASRAGDRSSRTPYRTTRVRR